MEGRCWTVLTPMDSFNVDYSWYAAFIFLFFFVFPHSHALPVCLEFRVDCRFLITTGYPSVIQAVFLLGSVMRSLLGPVLLVGLDDGQAPSSLLSFNYRPAAEPEGTHHFPRCGTCSGVHTLNAIGQWHHSPATPGEVGLSLSQPPTEHFKLHQQILDIPRAGWTRGPHARHLLLWWVSLK